MSGINKAIILGHIGKDPETRYTSSGTCVCNFSVATSFKPKDGEEKTEWHRITAWGRLGEIVNEYCKKGSQIFVEGRIETRKWQDKEGNDRFTTEIIAERVQLIGGKSDGGERPASKPAQKPAAQPSIADMEDDIPF